MAASFTVGTPVRRKRDGASGIVTAVDDREIVVKFDPTFALCKSPWGEYVDKGSEGHFFHRFAERMIEVAS